MKARYFSHKTHTQYWAEIILIDPYLEKKVITTKLTNSKRSLVRLVMRLMNDMNITDFEVIR